MGSEQFPMFRLATLLARQASAPLAARIKQYALSHQGAGAALCVWCARTYRRAEWGARTMALRLAGTALPAPARAPPLSRSHALNLGGDLLGEIIVFSLGSLIIIFEVNRQAMKQEDKVLEERSRWLAVQLSLEELQSELVLQQADIDRLRRALADLARAS